MLRRRCASAAAPPQYRPSSSGPRWVMTSRIRVARDGADSSSRSTATIPAIPHMSGCDSDRHRTAHVIHELAEPEFQHHQAPQTMTMVARAAAMLLPDAPDLGPLEDAAIVEPAVQQQIVDHRCERAAQPPPDRRLESLLRAVDDRLRYPLREETAQQVLAAAVRKLERRGNGRDELEERVVEQRVARFE